MSLIDWKSWITKLRPLLSKLWYWRWYLRLANAYKLLNKEEVKTKFDNKCAMYLSPLVLHFDLQAYSAQGDFQWLKQLHGKPLNLEGLNYVVLAHAFLIGKNAVVVDTKGNVILESVGGTTYDLQKTGDAKYLMNRWRLKREKSITTGCSLITPYSNNYFHWIIEALPRLKAVKDFERLSGKSVKIIYDQSSEVQKQILELLGFKNQLMAWKGHKTKISELLIPDQPYAHISVEGLKGQDFIRIYHKEGLSWVRKRLLEAVRDIPFEREDLKGITRFIVSRQKAPGRKLLNEDELLKRLKGQGFTKVFMEDLCFTDQVKLFEAAEVILTAHGASLSNLLFARHPKVVEIYPAQRNEMHAFCYMQLVQFFNFEHYILKVPVSNDKEDMRLNPKQMEQLVALTD